MLLPATGSCLTRIHPCCITLLALTALRVLSTCSLACTRTNKFVSCLLNWKLVRSDWSYMSPDSENTSPHHGQIRKPRTLHMTPWRTISPTNTKHANLSRQVTIFIFCSWYLAVFRVHSTSDENVSSYPPVRAGFPSYLRLTP